MTYHGDRVEVYNADALETLKGMESESIQMVCTSPPYWGRMRDYGGQDQLGHEPDFRDYLVTLITIFSEVRRVLRNDGVLWLNVGDTRMSNWPCPRKNVMGNGSMPNGKRSARPSRLCGLKEKDLCMIPARLAIGLQEEGWYLRSRIVWEKPNCMSESCRDRPTDSTEDIFLLSKSPTYFYDYKVASEPRVSKNNVCGPNSRANKDLVDRGIKKQDLITSHRYKGYNARWEEKERLGETKDTRNWRNVWRVAPSTGSLHPATFPEELPRRCILAGTKEGDTVLDPFAGSGTTLAVALRLGRKAIGIELNAEYCKLIETRVLAETPSLMEDP